MPPAISLLASPFSEGQDLCCVPLDPLFSLPSHLIILAILISSFFLIFSTMSNSISSPLTYPSQSGTCLSPALGSKLLEFSRTSNYFLRHLVDWNSYYSLILFLPAIRGEKVSQFFSFLYHLTGESSFEASSRYFSISRVAIPLPPLLLLQGHAF